MSAVFNSLFMLHFSQWLCFSTHKLINSDMFSPSHTHTLTTCRQCVCSTHTSALDATAWCGRSGRWWKLFDANGDSITAVNLSEVCVCEESLPSRPLARGLSGGLLRRRREHLALNWPFVSRAARGRRGTLREQVCVLWNCAIVLLFLRGPIRAFQLGHEDVVSGSD